MSTTTSPTTATGGGWGQVPVEVTEVLELLAERVEQLAAAHASLVEAITDIPAGGPWLWRHLDSDQARRLGEQLRDWVDWLVPRYGLSAKIPPCWYRHPRHLEELTALYVAHKAAYNPRVSAATDAPINWHDRWLRPCIDRLPSLSYCSTSGHRPDTAHAASTDLGDFDQWLAGLDTARPLPAQPEEIADAVRDGAAVRLVDQEPNGPVRWLGRWWAQRTDRAQKADVQWTAQDEHAARRLDHFDDARPVDPLTGEVRADPATEPAWARSAWLAVSGMFLGPSRTVLRATLEEKDRR